MIKTNIERECLEVSLVFPAYNEAEKLERSVEKASSALRKITSSYEIIIAEDGSTDGTDKIASELSKKYTFVRHLHGRNRLGRGKALKNAFEKSKGAILVYMDLDLATNITHLKTLVSHVKEGYDLATGSRMLQRSAVERGVSRRTASKVYNFLVRFFLGSKVRDHQCGFKAFKRKPLLQIINEVTAGHWFWDTEIIVRYQRRGYKIKEFPVHWKGKNETKVSLFKDSLSMGIQILKLCWKLKKRTF